jgi:hypothetical protein
MLKKEMIEEQIEGKKETIELRSVEFNEIWKSQVKCYRVQERS